MLEPLSETEQEKVVEHLREYLEEISDQMRWNESFKKTSAKLSETARNDRNEIAAGRAEAMDFDKL